jgi:hypothetical protein
MSKENENINESQEQQLNTDAVSDSDIPKYTEKQVREAIEMAREPEYWDSGSYWGNLYGEDEIIEELNKST